MAVKSFIVQALGFTLKYHSKQRRINQDKRSSLFRQSVSVGEKSFITLTPGHPTPSGDLDDIDS
jgi:hypothetical protein